MKIGYFIARSLHYLPTVMPLIDETGGVLISFNPRTERSISNRKYRVLYYRNYTHLLNNFHNLGISILVHPSFSVHYFHENAGVKHVQVFHGISDKPFNFHSSLRKYDLITVPGYKMKEDIVARGLADPCKIAVIGYPKIDSFLQSDFDHRAFEDEIGIDTSRKTVLYSPTWDDPDSYSSFSKYIVPLLRSLRPYNVIVKPHPNTIRYRPWLIVKAFCYKRGNSLIILKSSSILPFMAISDIMLTDISSVSHEYLPFGKPMVFLSPKPKEHIPEEHRWIWQCGDVVETGSDLDDVVRDNLENPVKYKAQREIALNRIFLPFDGMSSKRFRDELAKLGDGS